MVVVVKRVTNRGRVVLLLLGAAQVGTVKVFVCSQGARKSVGSRRKYVDR